MQNISKIIKKLNIPEEYIDYYGKYKAKVSNKYLKELNENKDAKLILVTAINPTPLGEGKTTQSIGIAMGMNKINKNAICVLREPSLGPVFGVKGGAIGGGLSTIEPSLDINLHFNGDFNAITSANNLLVAVLENSIFQDNNLNVNPNTICIKRAIDMNDRGLRNVKINVGSKNQKIEYETGFEITAACELMAICCLCENEEELKQKLDNILVAYTYENTPVYARDLECTNAMFCLLKEAIKPNIVQTVESTPVLVHLGPFANIAHGCNSIIATRMGLKLADYCITEAGFGADLGAEKFFDIKCRKMGVIPDIAVLVVTVKALKYNGGASLENITNEDLHALEIGISNMKRHIENISKYNVPVVVCINRFNLDTDKEVNYILEFCKKINIQASVSTAFENGGEGTIELCEIICNDLEKKKPQFKFIYDNEDSITQKIEKVCTKIYGATSINYLEAAKIKIKQIEKLNVNSLPICIAKTPVSFTDNDKILGAPDNFSITIKNIRVLNGAGFIVVYAGNINTMPGLGKNSKYREF